MSNSDSLSKDGLDRLLENGLESGNHSQATTLTVLGCGKHSFFCIMKRGR